LPKYRRARSPRLEGVATERLPLANRFNILENDKPADDKPKHQDNRNSDKPTRASIRIAEAKKRVYGGPRQYKFRNKKTRRLFNTKGGTPVSDPRPQPRHGKPFVDCPPPPSTIKPDNRASDAHKIAGTATDHSATSDESPDDEAQIKEQDNTPIDQSSSVSEESTQHADEEAAFRLRAQSAATALLDHLQRLSAAIETREREATAMHDEISTEILTLFAQMRDLRDWQKEVDTHAQGVEKFHRDIEWLKEFKGSRTNKSVEQGVLELKKRVEEVEHATTKAWKDEDTSKLALNKRQAALIFGLAVKQACDELQFRTSSLEDFMCRLSLEHDTTTNTKKTGAAKDDYDEVAMTSIAHHWAQHIIDETSRLNVKGAETFTSVTLAPHVTKIPTPSFAVAFLIQVAADTLCRLFLTNDQTQRDRKTTARWCLCAYAALRPILARAFATMSHFSGGRHVNKNEVCEASWHLTNELERLALESKLPNVRMALRAWGIDPKFAPFEFFLPVTLCGTEPITLTPNPSLTPTAWR
jgi:hypothetical protein